MRRCLFLALSFLAASSYAADILVIFPFPGYSHVMPFMPILKELGLRGHKLTLVTSLIEKPNPQGFTQIDVNITTNDIKEMTKKVMGSGMSMSVMKFARGPLFQVAGILAMCGIFGTEILEKTWAHLPPPGTKFDLVMFEPFFCMEPLVAVSSIYNAPIVATLPMPLTPIVATSTGNPHEMAYVPNVRLPYTGKMTFLERVWNTIVNVSELLQWFLWYLPKQDKVMREVTKQPNLPYIGDLLHNISLVLAETHFALNYPRPYLRNVIEVGGVSAKIEKPLPKDLEKFINEAKDGVIYFSWGSHFDAEDAIETLEKIMKCFSKLKQKVVFKWSTEIPNTPANVRVEKWVPQPSILGHKNTLLFVSHGGLNSMYEAAYHGVPVLGTPLFADQLYNIQLLESLGMAIGVDTGVFDGGIFSSALDRILSNPSFRDNAKKVSGRLRDRPMDVVKEAAYWIEYVIKHGSSHLKPASINLPWYSVILLDVSLFLLAIISLIVFLLYSIIALCCKLCCRNSPKKVSQKKKKQ
uniref:UDP-glucuronosyltransferase n=1 Tax=Riptortus pedestris TaxID=329032 RepID=R4WJC4_RIPPE|nr:glucosyl/glucuronosyl transferases [Riptortus pedestris]